MKKKHQVDPFSVTRHFVCNLQVRHVWTRLLGVAASYHPSDNSMVFYPSFVVSSYEAYGRTCILSCSRVLHLTRDRANFNSSSSTRMSVLDFVTAPSGSLELTRPVGVFNLSPFTRTRRSFAILSLNSRETRNIFLKINESNTWFYFAKSLEHWEFSSYLLLWEVIFSISLLATRGEERIIHYNIELFFCFRILVNAIISKTRTAYLAGKVEQGSWYAEKLPLRRQANLFGI